MVLTEQGGVGAQGPAYSWRPPSPKKVGRTSPDPGQRYASSGGAVLGEHTKGVFFFCRKKLDISKRAGLLETIGAFFSFFVVAAETSAGN